MRKLLVIDDDLACCKLICGLLRTDLLDITLAHDVATGVRKFTELMPDLVLLDVHLPDGDGISALTQILQRSPSTPVLMVTAENDLKTAIRAVKGGATDYLTKPISAVDLPARVRQELRQLDARDQIDDSQRHSILPLADTFGPSEASQHLVRQIEAAANSEITTLVVGETGTGKELVAHSIHRHGVRRTAPFVTIDCKSPPPWLLESELFSDTPATASTVARGGTLYLGDVAGLADPLQARLLRVLDRRKLRAAGAPDVRIIAGTRVDLHAAAKAGTFRSELVYRLGAYVVNVRPLRERPADIEHLARLFLAEAMREQHRVTCTFEPGALAKLCSHHWPGNGRELRNVVRQLVLEATGAVISPSAVARVLGMALGVEADGEAPSRTLKEIGDAAAHEAERLAIAQTLRTTKGNKSQAARVLKTDYKTLHTKIKQFGIVTRDTDDEP